MPEPRALVGNAADEAQVADAKRREKDARALELDDLRALLELPQGRRFVWRLLGHCKVFESIWHPSALIHHNAGRQDVGHFVLAEINEARPEALLLMMQEAKNQETSNA